MPGHPSPVRPLAVAAILALAVAQGLASSGRAAADASPVDARRAAPVHVPPSIAEAAARDGRVRIIVSLAVPFTPEGRLGSDNRARQRMDIAATQDAVLSALAAFDVQGVKRFRVIPAIAAEVDEAALQALAWMPGVASIEEDALGRPALGESTAIIGAPAVWASGTTGAGQTIAILDTGVQSSHPFFGGRVVSQACYSTTSVVNVLNSICPGGVAAATGPGSGEPCGLSGCDHGTLVAGVAAGANGTPGGAPIHGVARGANLISIQVFSRTLNVLVSTASDQIAGMQRVYDLRNTYSIASVNISIHSGQSTTPCDGSAQKAMIDTLASVGIATVVSSGDASLTNALAMPACISTAISVGSTTDGSGGAPPIDKVSTTSNSASFLKLLAPGQVIVSSVIGGGYLAKSGTSLAAPHVAGAWALLKSRHPTASVAQVLTALQSTGTNILDTRNGLTFKRINVNLAIDALTPCTYSLSQTSVTVPATAGTGSVNVVTQAGCPWLAVSTAGFLTITGGASGTGNGTVSFSFTSNGGPPRTGTLGIAGHTFTVTQQAASGPILDLNGDGRLDLLWHHQTTGQIAGWLMNGLQLVDGTLLTPSQVPDTHWKCVGAGDLDGDGRIDLVWQNVADGRTSAWLMNGLTLREGALFSIPQVADLQWKIRSVGDLNGDGRADLFWQHEGTGQLAAWLMNGLTVIDGTLLTPSSIADLQWKLVGTADFDRNGSRDLVFHHQGDGRIAIWYMNGTSQIGGSVTSPPAVADLNWKIRAVGDLNSDGNPDFVFQNVADGRISAWLMNGLTLAQGALLSTSVVADTNWHVVGPR